MAKGVYKRSPETVLRLQEWTKNNKHPFPKGHKTNAGVKWTKERREKHSKIFKGRIITPEWRRKLSEANKDKIGELAPGYKHGRYVVIGAVRRNAPPETELCEVCGFPGKELKHGLYIDHDHKTGKFRGWLCHRCNCALGFVHDNTETLKALIIYLQSRT